MGTITKTRISFNSNGSRCAGYLYTPTLETKQLPCVVLANGFTGTMDWLLPSYAEKFAEAGFAALIFDYRYFGESEGEPRQLVDVRRQRDDIRAAVAFVRSQEKIDQNRVALWGTSLGGGNVFYVAVDDPSIAAVIAQVPGFDMISPQARATIKIPGTVIVKLLLAAVWDQIRGRLGRSPYYAKVFANPGDLGIFSDQKLKPNFEKLMQGSKSWRNRFTPRFYLALPKYKRGTAERLKAPLLVCVAKRDVYSNPRFQAWVGKQAPLGRVIVYEADHFDLYHGMSEQATKDQIEFLQKNLI
jgi:uncharacterized protein